MKLRIICIALMMTLPWSFAYAMGEVPQATAVSENVTISNNVLIVSKVLRVYDGDTFYCDVNTVHPLLGKDIGIRINGIDTPEMKGSSPEVKALAIKARDLVANKLQNARVIELRNIKRGKYFRIVADVYADGVNIADLLIQAGLAKPYDGGTKEDW